MESPAEFRGRYLVVGKDSGEFRLDIAARILSGKEQYIAFRVRYVRQKRTAGHYRNRIDQDKTRLVDAWWSYVHRLQDFA